MEDDFDRRMKLQDAIGYDLVAALYNNPGNATPGHALVWTDLEGAAVLHELTGENDGPEWHWLVRLADGRHAYIHGGCDYTGWDCQSWADVHVAAAFAECMALVGQDERRIFEDMIAKGERTRAAVRPTYDAPEAA